MIDWRAVREESVDLLRRYVRFPTINDPERLDEQTAADRPWLAGRECEAVDWLAHVLKREGVEAHVLESAPGRSNLIARIPAEGRGDSLTLLSHADVVPADPADWKSGADPFGGDVRDGFLFGRGVLDLKGLGIAQVMTLLLLQRYRTRLSREVVLLIVADEECGGRFGAGWLLRERPELLRTGVVLGEGAYSLDNWIPGRGVLHAIAVAEKGYLELELSTHGRHHHASMPETGAAAERLIRALDRILRRKFPVRLTPATTRLLQHMGNAHGGLAGWLLGRPAAAARLGLLKPSRSTIVDAMLRDTVALTILEAGSKNNVAPGSARGVLSIRLLPGTDADAFEARIRKIVDDPEVQIRRTMFKPPTDTGFDSADYRLLERNAARPADGVVLPILSPGASDCRFWRAAGVACYGWVPFAIAPSDLHGVHGCDEKVSIDAFGAGIESFYRVVSQMAAPYTN
jgi:acetylornithine deacetylase/succinyl-diaminopimelate desuccinylase-like protein